MRKRLAVSSLLLVVAAGVWAGIAGLSGRPEAVDSFVQIDRPPRIEPDYADAVIPPNIAPLNFLVREAGSAYSVRIAGPQGDPVEVFSRKPAIRIRPRPWHALLEQNRGQELQIDVFVKAEDGRWNRFQAITNRVANEDIDRFLVYRKMHPTHLRVKGRIDIEVRDLTSFRKSVLLSSDSPENGCINCHAFAGNRSDKMLLGVRSPTYGVGTLLVDGPAVHQIDAKFGYTSWHPSGQVAVYAVNNLPMFYHSSRNEVRDTVDLDSFLACYLSDSKTIAVEPNLARKEHLENWPAWSGDGKHLYFCSAPMLWPRDTPSPPPQYDQVRYSLMRISYDLASDRWGELETVLSSKDTGKSIAMPRCSPDGRWLSFCMCDYGYFPAWQAGSDLCLMDLAARDTTGKPPYRRLEINSDVSESWQTWSSNSRWIVFSSKRLHGVFTRLFISYVDPDGTVHKPIVLPQKDPAFYESCLLTFNTPELVTDRPAATGETLARVFRSPKRLSVEMPLTMATPKAAGPTSESAWQAQRE